MRAAIIGAAGYVGGELLRLLAQHPNIKSWRATSRSQAGQLISAVHPAMRFTDARFSDATAGQAAKDADVVILALEHGEAAKVMAEVLAAQPTLVVDLSADFRVNDLALHETYYGPHPAAALVPQFRYGLADVDSSALKAAKAVAAPGCFATAAQLALFPLATVKVSQPALFAVTGSSGSGALPKATTHHPARAHNFFAYSTGGHRHDAEVLQSWRKWTKNSEAQATLLSHSGPFVRGIHLTLHTRCENPTDVARIPELFAKAYAGRPFVHVLENPVELTHVIGTNEAHLHVVTRPTGEVTVYCVIDNLLKGAAGQAVQAMNLALGWPETTGLLHGGIFPC